MSSELHSVEIPLINTLKKLGWTYLSAAENSSLRDGSVDEVLLKPLVIDALLKLNAHKGLKPEHCETLYNRINRVDDNEEFHAWLKGEKIFKPNQESKAISIDLINRVNPEENHFAVTNQYVCTITKPEDAQKHIRPDVVLFVNGIPISVLECKFLGTEGSTYAEGIKQLDRYQRTTPNLFVPNVFNISTDGHKLKYGATKSPPKYYMEWKHDCGTPNDIKDSSEFKAYAEENKRKFNPYIDVQVFGLLNKVNFIDLITNFIVFETRDNLTVKKIARYQQFRAVNKIVERVVKGEMKTGLIWHTQGSGKSLTMLFTAWKLRTLAELNNPTILIVVDRVDLDAQITETFGAVKLPNTTRASSIGGLRKKLKEDSREVIISTIFKFDEMADVLVERENVIILIDEAHRTQEGTNAAEMRRSLPNAFFFGFTGTPIDKSDKNTHRNFGLKPDGKVERYMDLYNIKAAIDDKATVPVHYQLRPREWRIDADQMDELIEAEHDHLSPEEMDVLKEQGSSYGKTFMMNPARLRKISEDITEHYTKYIEPNGFKAQIVAFSREACVIIKNHIDELLGEQYSAVVFSGGQNDAPELRKHHKSKQEIRDCVNLFKNKDSDLKFMIVQSMLLTGFDAPNEQVMYLDRPLKDHTLLQAIARTNRPFPNKLCGIIIDYCGILKNLNKALNFDESDISDCLIEFDQLKKQLPKFLEDFNDTFKDADNKSPFAIANYLQKNDKLSEFKESYKGLQISYETLAPDPFILEYTKQYAEATKLKLIVDSILSQEKPDISQYLPKTRQMIQEHITLGEVRENAPVFIVDDNYLKRLDGTALSEKEKELTLENRLRTVLRIKSSDLPIYKTLQERLEKIINRREEEVDDSYALLCSLMDDLNEAQDSEKSSDLSMGERAISQLIGEKLDNLELVSVITNELNAVVVSHTNDFNNWQQKETVVREIRRDIILKLAMLSKVHSAIQNDKIDYSKFSEQLMKYIIQHY
ncbi:type I restriction endonuclease subunit R [Flavobacteriaceae bacterium]|nr:type I restriction endonuclease subunit R [Flavobacteriaceae bacterium]